MLPEKEKILDKLELSLIHSRGDGSGFRPGLGLLFALYPVTLGLSRAPFGPVGPPAASMGATIHPLTHPPAHWHWWAGARAPQPSAGGKCHPSPNPSCGSSHHWEKSERVIELGLEHLGLSQRLCVPVGAGMFWNTHPQMGLPRTALLASNLMCTFHSARPWVPRWS